MVQLESDKDILGQNAFCYRPQRSWAKVIFLHLSVILLTGGVVWSWGVSPIFDGLQFFGGSPIFRGSPNLQGVSNFSGGPPIFFFKFFFFFFDNSFFPKISSGMHPPPETVNARPLRILLECILVQFT